MTQLGIEPQPSVLQALSPLDHGGGQSIIIMSSMWYNITMFVWNTENLIYFVYI